MVIVGLGTAGANIAKQFDKWSQYDVITLEVGKEIPVQDNVEAYEQNTPDFSEVFENTDDEVWFVVAGASQVAACSLAILEQIKDKKINIMHISSDPMFMSSKATLRERVVLGILQQYARCGLLEAIYLACNKTMINLLEDVLFSKALEETNKTLSSMIHYLNIYQKTDPMMGCKMEPKEISRIRTFALVDLEKSLEKSLFPLDNITETCYIYNIKKTEKSNDKKIQKIKTMMETKETSCKTSFAMYTTEYAQSFCHAIQMTHYIQQEEQ